MTDNEQVNEFLEHYGVAGMRWGVRKARSERVKRPDTRTPEKRSADRKKAAFKVAKAAVVIGVGALLVRSIINQHQGMKLGDMRRSQSSIKIGRNFANDPLFKTLKVSDMASKPKVSWKSEKATLEALKKNHARLNGEANVDLKKWYERSQTPLHLREYLSVPSYSEQINRDARSMVKGREATAEARRKAAESLATALKRNR
jgi:hypothetical protein